MDPIEWNFWLESNQDIDHFMHFVENEVGEVRENEMILLPL